jgi:chromosome transmission fidelity protein 4
MYDSAGLLSVLDRSRRPGQARWVPLLDGAAAAAAKPSKMRESYWPVDVSRTHLTCVLLRGEREPGFPRPILSEVDLCMPLLGLGENEAQGKLAESVVRSRVLASSSNDDTVATDRQLLQLLQAACKADELARALDITRMMSLPVTLDGAEKLAVSLYRHHALGQKIAALRQQKEGGTRRSVPVRDARERVRERESSPARRDPAREFASFSAPRRRMLGRDRPVTPGAGSVTVVPATPGEDDDAVGVTPGFDDDIYAFEDSSSAVAAAAPPPAFAASPPKRKREREDDPFAQPKNPFAKKEKAANPFAKPASVQSTARPLDSVKSTSFFDRVDDIEGHKREYKKSTTKT